MYLAPGVCHLWYWLPDPSAELPLRLLAPEELVRYQRYRVPEAARTFLAARVLVRRILSLYADVEPAAWRFEMNEWGRPRIADPGVAGLDFNLSHKRSFITCLVGRGRQLGVDVEEVSARSPHLLAIADRFFSPEEAAGLRALPPAEQPNRFFCLWTLKEAYIKARERGLSLGLSKFSFTVAEDRAKVRFDPGFGGDPEKWDFRLFRPEPEYLIATAAERPVRIEMREAGERMVA